MKKNRKFITYGMVAAAILSMTACAADGEAVIPSSAEVETLDADMMSTVSMEEGASDAESVSPVSTEERVLEAESVSPVSTEERVSATESVSPASTEEGASATESVSPASTEEGVSATESVSPALTEEETLNIETENTYDEPVLLEDYYNTPSGKAAIDADFEDLAAEGMSVTISVVMDEIVVTVKYEDHALLTEGINATLTQQLDSMTERFWEQTIAYDEIITWRCVLTVRYTDPEDNLLAEQSYSAE